MLILLLKQDVKPSLFDPVPSAMADQLSFFFEAFLITNDKTLREYVYVMMLCANISAVPVVWVRGEHGDIEMV